MTEANVENTNEEFWLSIQNSCRGGRNANSLDDGKAARASESDELHKRKEENEKKSTEYEKGRKIADQTLLPWTVKGYRLSSRKRTAARSRSAHSLRHENSVSAAA